MSSTIKKGYGNAENFIDDYLATGAPTSTARNVFKRPMPGVKSIDVTFL